MWSYLAGGCLTQRSLNEHLYNNTSHFFSNASSYERYKLSEDENQMSVVQKSKRVCVSISERKWHESSGMHGSKERLTEN